VLLNAVCTHPVEWIFRRVGCRSGTCWWFTNLYSNNRSTVPLLCISLLLSSYMFQINCHHQGANIYIIKIQFTNQHFTTF